MSTDIIQEQLKNLNRTFKNFKGNIKVNTTPKGTQVVLSFTTT